MAPALNAAVHLAVSDGTPVGKHWFRRWKKTVLPKNLQLSDYVKQKEL